MAVFSSFINLPRLVSSGKLLFPSATLLPPKSERAEYVGVVDSEVREA